MKAFMVMKELVVITRGRERSWLVRREHRGVVGVSAGSMVECLALVWRLFKRMKGSHCN